MTMMKPSEFVIERIGGLTKTARLLSTDEKSFPITTVQGWKDRGEIPQKHWKALIEAAKDAGITLTISDFVDVPSEAAE